MDAQITSELTSDIDVVRLVQDMKQAGIEVGILLHALQLILISFRACILPWMLVITYAILSIIAR